jgi:hypothetical protein
MISLIDMPGSILLRNHPVLVIFTTQMFARRRAELVWNYGKSGERRVMAIPQPPLLYCW